MLNNFYFKDDTEPIEISFGRKGFIEDCVTYLSEEYNYSMKEMMKDTGLTDDDFKDLYIEDMAAVDFIDLIMEETGFNKSNYFNIYLSGGRNL